MSTREFSSPSATWANAAVSLLSHINSHAQLDQAARLSIASQSGVFLPELRRRRIDSLLYFFEGTTTPLQQVYNAGWAIQRSNLVTVLQQFTENDLQAIVFKGAEHIEQHFGSENLSGIHDVDILVQREDLPGVKAILYGLGYRQAALDTDSGRLIDVDALDVAQFEANSRFELHSFSRVDHFPVTPEQRALSTIWNRKPFLPLDNDALVTTSIDVHYSIGEQFDVGSAFRRSMPSSLGYCQTLNPADHLWFTASKYYREVILTGRYGLREFAYVAKMANDPALNWDLVIKNARETNTCPCLYYVLSFLARIESITISPDVLAALNPLTNDRRNDFGWMVGRLLQVADPPPAIAPLPMATYSR